MAGLTGYTLLLAVTACLLVRWLGVWDDVRTVMLLTVLMFLATSVTFDEVLAVAPMRGMACFLGGLAFAVAVSEGMLRGARLRLPLAFRVPYYLHPRAFLSVPGGARSAPGPAPERGARVGPVRLLARRRAGRPDAAAGQSGAAGLMSATTAAPGRGPGIPGRFSACSVSGSWRGRRFFAGRCTTWPWDGEPYIFGPYFLVPFLFGVAILLLEIGLVERNKPVMRTGTCFPGDAGHLAAVGHRHETVYQEFLSSSRPTLGGTPLYLTLVGLSRLLRLRLVPRVRWRRALTVVLLCPGLRRAGHERSRWAGVAATPAASGRGRSAILPGLH